MKGICNLILMLTLLFNVQVSFTQENHNHDHGRFDEIFGPWTLSRVVEKVNSVERYDSESHVQHFVDSSYMSFQGQIKQLISQNPGLSPLDAAPLFTDFLNQLETNIKLIPKGSKEGPGTPKILNGPCVNMDFETGNLTGWDLFRGTRTAATLYNFSAPVPVGPGANHQIFGGGVDPVVGIPRVAPGGTFSCRLGNGTTTGSGAARMSQPFLVNATNMYFTYQYAVVFQSPDGHTANERPYFSVRVYDQAGNNIPCGEYSVYADAANASSYQSIVSGGNTILYTNWTSVFTNLSAYVGQNVTVEFTTGDCSLSGHYGYAYVDASCVLQTLVATPGVICPGQSTTLTAPAGVGTFTWNTGATTQAINTSTPGNYSVLLTPPQGAACAVTLNTIVTEYPAPTAAYTTTAPSCFGTPVTFTSTSSIPAPGIIATYQWNFGDGTISPASSGAMVGVLNTTGTYVLPTHTYAAAGTYNVTLTVVSTNGCISTITTPITVYALPTLSRTFVNVLCNGGSTGSVNLTVVGGNAPYTYAWSNGAITEDLTGVPAGTYSVVVTTATGCTSTISATITQPAAALTLATTQTNVLCFGGSTGGINLTPSGGTAPYTYAWSNGAITQDLSGIPAGTYTVVVNDANGSTGGCTATTTVTISQPAASLTLNTTQTNIFCNGAAAGNIDLTPSGGTAPYTYVWSNGAITQDLSGLTAGTYTVTVNDANGSSGGCSASTSVTITQPATPVSIAFTQTNVLCNGGATGAINITASGGTPGYTYAWSNGAITEDLSGIPAGTYTVIVNDAAGVTSGCTATTTVTITQPVAALSTSFTQVNILCNGASTGSINLSVAGGTAPYSYLWSNGAITQDIGSLGAGTYSVVVNDANGSLGGCTANSSVTITQPAAALSLATTQVNVLCFGGPTGSIDLTPSGGTAPYTYAWSNGAITQDLSGLVAGTYSVNVTDANGLVGGCAATTSVTITQPAAAVSLATTQTNILCNGGNTGAINLTVAGGTLPYTYSWSNGAIIENLSALTAGTYTVNVNDANGIAGGCASVASVTITQPLAPLTLITSQVNVLCNGGLTGSINLTPSGGTAPYTYSWSNGAITQDLTGIAAGTYTVIVNDANGGTGGCAATTTVTITQPAAALSVSATQTNVLCFGGTTGAIDLTPAGGTAPYTYSWSNGAVTQDLTGIVAGTYTVNVNDANGLVAGCAASTTVTITQPAAAVSLATTQTNILCNGGNTGAINLTVAGGTMPYSFAWSNGAVTIDLTSLTAGTYTVIVTDANGSTGGCTATTSVTITQPLAPLTLNFIQTNVLCNGGLTGAINLTPSGGTAPYTYSWSNGAITEDLAGIAAGAYTVIVNDANGGSGGCAATTTVTITQPVAALSLAYTQTNVLCNGATTGAIDLTPAGGTAPYTYSWSNGAISQDLIGLAAGTYTVNVNDVNGLTGGCFASTTVTITQPPVLTQNVAAFTYPSGTNISCFGLSDGSVNLTIGGGNPAYSYLWSNGATTEDLTNVPAGTYSVTVTDLNGCTILSTITLTQPALLTSNVVSSLYAGGYNLSGCANDGSINFTIAGGNPAYSYTWSSGQISEDISTLAAGTYNVTVTDVNGCVTTSTATLTAPPALTQSITAAVYPSGTNISCFGLSDGSIDLTIGGGVPGYSYLWSNGAITQDIIGLPVGTYSVTVTDLNGCQITSSITLTQPTDLTSALNPSVFAGGFNVSGCTPDGTIDLTPGGGSPAYSYLWSNGATTQDLANLSAGNYTVTITDVNGCQEVTSIVLIQPAGLTQTITATTFPSGTNISCFGLSDGNIDLTIGDGVPGYTYLWNTGAVTEDLTNVPAGTYGVTVTDQVGCQISASITLIQPAVLTQNVTAALYPSGTNISCFGLSDGSVNLTINGGNPAYSYAWSNGAITQDLVGLSAGTYSVVVTDVNGCSIPSSITLVQPTALTQGITAATYPSGTNISCFGLSDGSIDLTIGGGNPGYMYMWSNGAISQDLSNVPAGTYNITVTDINGCTIPSTITLTQPALLTQGITAVTYPSGTNISCFGLNDGSIDLTIGGGNPGYSYVWSNGAITQDLTTLTAGTYSVVVTDINGCSIPSTITLSQPTALTQGITAATYPSGTNISCFGLSDGSIDLTVNGANPAYSYAWSNGAITQDLVGLTAGTYSVVVTDVNGCSIPSTITLTEPSALTQGITAATYPSGTNISCFGLSDGSVDLTIGGGNPGYAYVWSNGAGTQDITGLVAGTYSVTVTDINGCTIPSSITLVQPTALTQGIAAATYPSGTNISCFGLSDGSVDLTIGGGNPAYTYVWSNGAGTQDLANVPAGTYNVTVTDINGCSIPSTITLTQPTLLTQGISAVTYPSGTNISCFGLSDGSVNLTIGGGNLGYSFLWSNGSITEDLVGLPVGTYSVVVTDINGCTIPSTITLTEPTLLTSNVVPSVYAGGFNVSGCIDDGTIDLTPAAGNPGYSYMWSNGATNQDLSALAAGTYDVTITDINGCQTTNSITLTQPIGLSETISAFTYPSGTNISCIGLSDGSIDLTISNGAPGYTYLWSNGAVTEDLANVPVGTYNVTATDQNGCQIASTITLVQPTALTQNATGFTYPSGTNISCFGFSDGSVDLTIGGGNPGYTYLWNTGAITEDISGLPTGTYSVLVTDINGCTIPSSITLNQPTILTENIIADTYPSGNNISCFGLSDGSIDLTIGGGNPGYTYVWSNGAITEDLVGLPIGTYDVVVTDINGCIINSTITLDEPTTLTSSDVVSVYAGGFNVSGCVDDGSIDLTPAGGSPTYTYVWSNGGLTQDISNLAAGTYTVTITDVNGCQSTLTETLTEPADMTSVTSVTSNYNGEDISCVGASDGAITVVPAGGAGPYTFSWENALGVVVSNLQSPSGLVAGLYTVEITDQNGCVISDDIVLTDPPAFIFNVNVASNYNGEDISCFGASDGAINLTVNGATPGYTYSWTNAANAVVSTIQDPFSLPAGQYDVLVTDANGCTFTTAITLTEPPVLGGIASVTSDYNGQDVSCFNSLDGSVTVNATGGVPGYTYSWTNLTTGANAGNNENVNNVGAGNLTVQVTDLNGCVYNTNVIVTQPAVLTLDANIISNYFGQAVSCVGATDGIVDGDVTGGTPGYQYSWNGGPFTALNPNNNLGVGITTLLVMDANGCTVEDQVDLDANPLPTFDLPPVIYSCEGYQVSINSNAEPGSSCTWVFSDGQVINDCGPVYVSFPEQEMCYDMQLTVINAQGCINSTAMTDFICVVPNPVASFSPSEYEVSSTNPGINFNNSSVNAENYFWDFGDDSPLSQAENPYHEYPVDENTTQFDVWLYAISIYGCIDSTMRVITVKEDMIIYVPNTFTPDGDEFNNEFRPVITSGFSQDGYSLLIFNRWGQLIFESHDQAVGWDGTYNGQRSQDGTYTWKIILKNVENDNKEEYVGHVNLLR